ncbi:MAG TPA: hypothetical protein VLU25_06965 [Acidobacteriota bacterium]|nr:hypothetical protein [Acidobacteriota bacterium]
MSKAAILGEFINAASLLAQVLSGVTGETFPIGVEIENRTPYDLVLTPGFPFMPSRSNADKPQCGQTGNPSFLAAPPIRIYAASSKTSKDVAAIGGHAIGLDGNVGSISYQGYYGNSPIFSFMLAWFLGGGFHPGFVLLADADGTKYDNQGATYFKTGGYLVNHPPCYPPDLPDIWQTTSYVHSLLKVKVGNKSESIRLQAVPGGNNDGYQLVLEVSQVGYTPPDNE